MTRAERRQIDALQGWVGHCPLRGADWASGVQPLGRFWWKAGMGMRRVHRVFIVEDAPSTQRQLIRAVECHAELSLAGVARSPRAARELLESCGGRDVALVDLGLTNGNGMSLIPEHVRPKPTPRYW